MNKEEFERKWREIAEESDGYVEAEVVLNDGNIIYCDSYNFIYGKLELYSSHCLIASVNVSTVESIQCHSVEGNLDE